MNFRKKPVVIDAVQWNKDGDHPNVVPLPGKVSDTLEERAMGWSPMKCRWIGTLEGGHIVTPGDWIITGVQGEQYPCKPDIFAATYELGDADIRDSAEEVQNFAEAMKDRMEMQRVNGRSGWRECPAEDLREMLSACVAKGDPLDVANFCMMLWSLGEETST